MRKAGEKFNFDFSGDDRDMVEIEDGVKIKKDEVKNHLKENYKKKNQYGVQL